MMRNAHSACAPEHAGCAPSPRSCGERVGVRGASTDSALADRTPPPHPPPPHKEGGEGAHRARRAAIGSHMVTAASPARIDPAAAAAEPILMVDEVSKRFDTPEGPLVAIDRMSFTVAPGEFLAVIGPSGCGKSTLFNIIGGLLDGYDGRITVAGGTVSGPHAPDGMIFQEECTFPWRSA